jgi:hypothetical protein
VSAIAPMVERTPEHRLRFNLHPGQQRAFWSNKRFVLVLAGLQSGKTSMGALWLWAEMQRKGPGDYLVAAPTFPLMEMKLVPEFKRLFVQQLQAGTYQGSPVRVFTLNPHGEQMLWGKPQDETTRVIFGFGADPDSLESATAKAAWLDEAGQKKFKRESWVSIQGRLSLHQGRVFITTTPYTMGWLKSELYDPWIAADRNHPDIEVVNFRSVDNPLFRRVEYERMKSILPGWMFTMRYDGLFQRPAGQIYDCWSDENILPWFAIPEHWPRFLGLDFGGVNTAAIFIARELAQDGAATGRYIGYREYLAGGKTAAQHATTLRTGEPMIPTAVGGSKSEGQWRSEFAAGGLGIHPPVVSDVEIGIQRVYGLIKAKQFVILDTGMGGFLDQVQSYSRPLDENGEPTEGIEDKDTYHYLDAARYILGFLAAGLDGSWVA